jgi:hypothetical protein
MFEPVVTKPYGEIRSDMAAAEAKERGCVVVLPKENELFIDIDSEEQDGAFERAIAIYRRHRSAVAVKTPSPSGEPDHFHVVVRLTKTVDARERIMLQACMGSDPVREMLSLLRLERGDPNPTLFFEKKP